MKTKPATTATAEDPRLAPPKHPIKRTSPGPAVHPGRILRIYYLEDRGISQTQFAQLTGLPVSRINDIVKERRGITMDAAIRIGKVLDTEEQFWLNLQNSYERALAWQAKGTEYAKIRPLPIPQPA